MLAAPLVAWQFIRWRPRRLLVQRLSSMGLVAGVAVLALLSTLKATNEPLLSNKWQFYTPSEMDALDWADVALLSHSVWTEYDERLVVADGIRRGGIPRTIALDRNIPDPQTRDLMVSDITRARGTRLLTQLPTSADDSVTYDNGQAQIYHLRPRTPYQR
jgi:hypothetical protein